MKQSLLKINAKYNYKAVYATVSCVKLLISDAVNGKKRP